MTPREPMGVAIRVEPGAAIERTTPGVTIPRLLHAYLAGRNANTRDAYARDMEAFARFLGVPSIAAAAEHLLSRGHGDANVLAFEYLNHLVDRGLAPSTVNRHLSSLKSLVKTARVFGMVPWVLEAPRMKAQAYRDTRGPGREGFLRLIQKLTERRDPKGLRDMAIIRLLYERALRANEVRMLDLADIDFAASKINVLGKGRTQKEWLTIAPSTATALREWVACRGKAPGPLFCGFRGGLGYRKGAPLVIPKELRRISRQWVYRTVKDLGESIDLRVWPHGLRHAAITAALDRGENIRSVQRFSRHKDMATLQIYDDNRSDLGGAVARAISEPERKAPPVEPARTEESEFWMKKEREAVNTLRRRRR